jgi:GtrA-like protein
MTLAIRYAIFALIATIANIAAQDLVMRASADALLLSVLVGTAVGLGVKYVLDKKFIFFFHTQNARHDAQIFVLYAVMGLLTTAIFWGFEFGFNYFFQTKTMRYAGGILGLAIGYLAKYQLDKRYVFNEAKN